MRNLLNKQSYRSIQIIEMLVFSDTWITQGKMAQKLEVSERTMAEDIALVRKHYAELLDLQSSNKLGIRARNRNVAVLNTILSDIFRSSFILQWVELVFLYPDNSTLFYAKRLNVSESTLYKLYPTLKQKLKQSGLNFKRSYGNYVIESENESFVRTFFTTFFIEMYGLNVLSENTHMQRLNLYNKIIVNHLDQHLFSKLPEMDLLHRQFYLMFFFVSFFRANQGYNLNINKTNNHNLKIDYGVIRRSYTHIHNQQINDILSLFDTSIRRPNLEEAKTHQDFQQINNMIHSFLDRINADYTEEMLNDFSRIFIEITNMFKLLPYRIASMYSRTDYFCIVFKQYHHSVYMALEDALHHYSFSFDVYYPSIIESILFWMCVEHPTFYHQVKSKSILVVSDLGVKHAKFICHLLELYYNNPKLVNVSTTPTSYAHTDIRRLSQDYDLVVSTTHNIDTDKVPFFCVSDYPNDDILFQIYKHMIRDSHLAIDQLFNF